MSDEVRQRLEVRVPPRWSGVEIDDGWISLVDELDRKLAALDPEYQLMQCKSKFGGLRFYAYTGRFDVMPQFRELIGEAEARSYRICEWCGEPGSGVTIRGWAWTLCVAHRDEKMRRDE